MPDLRSHLTTEASASPHYDKWESRRFKNQCRRSAQELQTRRAVMESRGRRFTVGALDDHNQLSNVIDPNAKKGVMLPPLLGIPDQVVEEKELLPLIKSLPSSSQQKPTLPFAALFDLPTHLRLRSRCILNRATGLAAVKHYHNDDPDPMLRQCPHCINSAVQYQAQTLFHALVECPRFQVKRQELFDKLRDLIKRVRDRARSHRYASQIFIDNNITFVHIILSTPYVIESINNFSSRLKLLRQTGQFLEHIDSINPL